MLKTTAQYHSKVELQKVKIKGLQMREKALLKEVELLKTQVEKPVEGSMLINKKEYNIGDIIKQYGDNVYNDEVDRLLDMCKYYLCHKCQGSFIRLLRSKKRTPKVSL